MKLLKMCKEKKELKHVQGEERIKACTGRRMKMCREKKEQGRRMNMCRGKNETFENVQ